VSAKGNSSNFERELSFLLGMTPQCQSVEFMSQLSSAVSIHPYFQIQAGKVDAFAEVIATFIQATAPEDGCLYYDFTLNGDEAFCREAYTNGDTALFHLQNVDHVIKQALEIATMTRLEIHGPAAELEKMRAPLVGLNPAWFVHQGGVAK
jgi:quinol monooxygenase YgiN